MEKRLKSTILGLLVFTGFGVLAGLDISRYWPLLISVSAAILLVAWLLHLWWRSHLRGKLLGQLADRKQLKALSWRDFELACAGLFERQGYDVSLTPASQDGGVDIVLRRHGQKTIVQCKHWKSRYVGVAEVRELLGAKQDFGADEAYMVTSGFASQDARKLARRNSGLHVWDRDQLINHATRVLIADATREALKRESPTEPDPPQVPTERICPICGEKLVVRDGRYGRFIGCTGFPKCRYTCDLRDEEDTPA